MGQTETRSHPTTPPAVSLTQQRHIQHHVNTLLRNSKAPTTWATYNRAIQSYEQFHQTQHGVPPTLPYSAQSVSAFVAHLDLLNRSPSTVSTMLSAIAHVHKIANLPDPTSSYLVRQVQLGSRRGHSTDDTRQPITKLILHSIYAAIPALATTPYMAALFQSLFLLCFHAFLRPGEVTLSGASTQHVLTTNQISIEYQDSRPSAMTLSFQSYKHSQGVKPVIRIPATPHPCPIQALIQFFKFRGSSPGFIYITQDGSLLTRDRFSKFLSNSLRYAGFDPSQYNPHSFRIGAASEAAEQGFSALQIRDMGRWKSDAFHKYIRRPVIQMSSFN